MKVKKRLISKVSPYSLTWSTVFTCLRILLIPFIMSSLLNHQWISATLLFSCAVITDVVDGSLARFLQETTLLGTYLDPIADKLLIISCLATFCVTSNPLFIIPRWFFLLVCCKEALLVLGAWFCLKYNPRLIRPSIWGKTAMVVQSMSIMVWLLSLALQSFSPLLFHGSLIVMTACMIIALVDYALQMVLGVLWIKN